MAPVVRELVDFFEQQEKCRLPAKGLKLPDNGSFLKNISCNEAWGYLFIQSTVARRRNEWSA